MRRSGRTQTAWIRLATKALLHDSRVTQLPCGHRMLWLTSIAWCRDEERDGDVPLGMLGHLAAIADCHDAHFAADELVRVGLWADVRDGWVILNYSVWQQTQVEIDEQRARGRAARGVNPQPNPQPETNADLLEGLEVRSEQVERERGEVRGKNVRTTGGLTPSLRRQVELVFDAWKEATGHPKARLDDKRAKLIHRALAGYDLDTVTAAVRGWQWSPHHRGENERGTVYNGLELLLRDAAHIERFAAWEENPSLRPQRGPALSRVDEQVMDANRELAFLRAAHADRRRLQ